ncbi:hypothetical protein BJV77DRAFT_1066682 [Russula vinacea]|nr:hypothetical protein BJV77DRAFT_1066682 [Russula vinacea]
MSTSGQFLTVPPMSHRSAQHHRRDSARAAAQSPRMHHPATRNVASSSRVKIEDTPLGIAVSPSSPLAQSSPSPARPADDAAHASTPRRPPHRPPPATSSPSSPSTILPAAAANPNAHSNSNPRAARSRSPQLQPPQLSPRSIFRAMPFLLRLRSPSSDLVNMTCTSGGPRTHAVLSKCPINKAPQPLTYNQTLVCEDAVNAEVLLRLARNELLERAQQADRRVTALVDEEWRYTIRQTKNGDYNVQVFYSACPAQCENQNSNETVDPRKPVALSHVTNVPGLMRVVHSE